MKSTGLCSSKLLLLLLIIVLTIVVVNIALNSFNKEMFSNNNNTGGAALFHSNLLPQLLQTEVNHINERNPAAADNNLLSAKHLKQVYETRRPELITPNNKSPQKLCYIDLESL
tara:strand:- start:903 stop:1244 length:342 start_codon:yes stop_codon:yes gene_type:complete